MNGALDRFGVSEFTTWPWPFERDVERYAAHGVDAIEVCEFKLNRNDYAPQLQSVRSVRSDGQFRAVDGALAFPR